MACTSGSVQKVADKTLEAKNQIERLQTMIRNQSEDHKIQFFKEVNHQLQDADISDAREIGYNYDIKTEYTSEFSLDKIAAVVVSALKAVAAAKDPTVATPAMSPEAIAAYADVVNTVAEAAKSKSTASASLSFSMNRLSPGLIAFLYASSVNIKDEDTFGTEAVTTTAIFYRFMQSIDDIKSQTQFNEALIDAKNLMNMKTLQAALTDDLANGIIDINEWNKKDDLYSAAILKIQARLDAKHFKAEPHLLMAGREHKARTLSEQVVEQAISKLSAMGDAYRIPVERARERLESVYFH